MNLIQLYAEAGRLDDAQRVYDSVVSASRDPERVRIGREALLFAQVRTAERLFESGKQNEAMAMLRGVLLRTNDDDLKAHLQRVIGGFDAHLAQQRQNDALRDIAAKANAGKYKEAVAMIDALLPGVDDEALREQLTLMRKDLAKRRAK
ncbi:MAG TPA: hypothetical protein VND45_11275 [Thermoanaerobaculia bacterium]|nr:hypothetical protein [Thermoanaerobaculia bacterium]